MATVSAPHKSFPESSHQLFTRDVPPSQANIALITDLIPDYRLSVLLHKLVRILRRPIEINPLQGTVRHPVLRKIIVGPAVMYRKHPVERIMRRHNLPIPLPIFRRLDPDEIELIGQ